MTGGCQHLENLVSVAIGKGQSWLRNVCTTLHIHVDQNGKLAEVVKEMDRYGMEAIRMSEAR